MYNFSCKLLDFKFLHLGYNSRNEDDFMTCYIIGEKREDGGKRMAKLMEMIVKVMKYCLK